MSSWNYGGSSSSNPIEDEPVIADIVEEFTCDDFYEDNANDQEIVLVRTMDYNPLGKSNYKNACNSNQKRQQCLPSNIITSPMDTTSMW